MEVKRIHQSSKRTFRDKLRLGFSKRRTQSLDEGYGFDIGETQEMRGEERHQERLNEKTVTQQRWSQRERNRKEGGSFYEKFSRQISADKKESKNVLIGESLNTEKCERRDTRTLVEDITEQIEEDLFKITMQRTEETNKNPHKDASYLQYCRTARYLCEITRVPVMLPNGEDISLRERFLMRRPAVVELDEGDRQKFLERLNLYIQAKELDSLHMI